MKKLNTILSSLLLLLISFTATSHADERVYTQSWMDDSGEISYFELEEGNHLRYLKTGKGEPLLLLHTIRPQLDYFEKVIPALSKHFTVYALDLPGHGYSTITKTEYADWWLMRNSPTRCWLNSTALENAKGITVFCVQPLPTGKAGWRHAASIKRSLYL